MIAKRPGDISLYNELLQNDILDAVGNLQRISSVIGTFRDFGNADSLTALVTLNMLAEVTSTLHNDLKSAAVSLSAVTSDHNVSDREIATAVGVSPTTFAKWNQKSEIPDYMNPEEEQTTS